MPQPARLAVFASGGGTNFQALLDYFNQQGSSVARIELLVASREGVGAITRAAAAGVPTIVIDPGQLEASLVSARTLEVLDSHAIDLIVLAGYLKLIPEAVVEAFSDRIVNIHPALLPAFGGAGMYGGRVHRAVLESGATVSGPTVHMVDARYDEGRIVAQWPVPVLRNDTSESLAARVLKVEHLLYPLAIEHLIDRGVPDCDSEQRGNLSFGLEVAEHPKLESIRHILRNTT